MLIADADIPYPVVQALKILEYEIATLEESNLPIRPDRDILQGALRLKGVIITKDTGIPSQAYLFEYAQYGLTVVVLRWKQSNPKAWQEMTEAILRDGASWEKLAAQTPSVISVNRYGSRARSWATIPSTIADQARASLPNQVSDT